MQEKTNNTGKPLIRVLCYIDGFNLYFGLREKNWRRYYWLNVHKLAESFLRPGQRLEAVRYFTTRVSSTPRDPNQDKRQNTYLEALATLPNTSLHYGHYLTKSVQCYNCHATWESHEEKMTDVNIATELMVDAFTDRFDRAIIVTADSDLTGPVERVRKLYPSKRIVVAFPPARVSERLKRAADNWFNIGQDSLRQNQLPDPVVKLDGHELRRPVEWR